MTRAADLPIVTVACCTPVTREPLSADAAADLARTLKAIADPARFAAAVADRRPRRR